MRVYFCSKCKAEIKTEFIRSPINHNVVCGSCGLNFYFDCKRKIWFYDNNYIDCLVR